MRLVNLKSICLFALFVPSMLLAQARHGLITSTSCPYSCIDAGIPKADCQERVRDNGRICEVEDFRQPAGHRVLFRQVAKVVKNADINRNPLVYSGSCPISCEDFSVPAVYCKKWQQGNQCFVEDLRAQAKSFVDNYRK